MEAALQPTVGQDGSLSNLAAGSALARARDVLMTPSATRATFESTTAVTPASARHVHWRDAVDAGDGWYCSNCLQLAIATRCEACGASRHELAAYAAPGELASITADAASCSYGRGLRFLQCREQSVMEGVGFRPGEAGYAEAVYAQTHALAHGTDVRRPAEERPHSSVCCFDAWLCLQTGDTESPARCSTREHVRAIVKRNDMEPLVTEYVQDFARQVHISGKAKPVHAMPKGGWWMRVCAQTTELDFHIVRAIVGMHVQTPVKGDAMQAAVTDGTMDLQWTWSCTRILRRWQLRSLRVWQLGSAVTEAARDGQGYGRLPLRALALKASLFHGLWWGN